MNKTVLKSMEIIQLFFDETELTLQQIVDKTKLPKTSAHRMAESLDQLGFLQKTDRHTYKLGLLLLRLGHLVAERLDVRKEALPIMRKLKEETGEAVNLVIKEKDEAVYIEKVDTTEHVRVYTQIGRRAPLYGGACPRIILAYLPEPEKERIIEQMVFEKYANGTILDKGKLRQVLKQSKEIGYAISHSELQDYASAIAAPVFNHNGEVIAGLSLVGPQVRFQNEAHIQFLVNRLKQATETISKRMGWKGDLEDDERSGF
ncbi:IclR family transcriptional regulator [Bacillus xiapuensis]|uniref:IclR family transcriptional regulator n=1 Tax=Bacillus xiapuensis TaxID=2014075 RepID=UPI000C24FBFE|nr:IclR family transcriptional regulator [Bacillus xiapuensis]